MTKNLIVERIVNVEILLDNMERIVSDEMTNEEYDSSEHIQEIHKEILKALNQIRRK